MKKNLDEWLEVNKNFHDNAATTYASVHSEIYNSIEQTRLKNKLKTLCEQLKPSTGEVLSALDFGSGAGNLSGLMLELGCSVTAVDVSENCLAEVRRRYAGYGKMLKTALINGRDLSNLPTGSFDICGTYSVLHHIPDYLYAVSELVRVTKSGGIIYIDHESSEEAWSDSEARTEYLRLYRASIPPLPFMDRYGPTALLKRIKVKLNKMKDPRYHEEGDIHIWPDDHIEWNLIEEKLKESGCHSIKKQDYLVCRERGKKTPLYDAYRDKYRDMSVMTAVKG